MPRIRAGAGIGACGIMVLCLSFLPSVLSQSPPAPSASATVGFVPFTTTFHPAIPGGSLYQWQFDYAAGSDFVPDYSSEASSDVSFTYQSAGSKTAHLRVYDTQTGLPSDYDVPLTVYPPPVPPTVTISGLDPHYAGVGVPVTFSASAVASPGRVVASYHWDFLGDGTSEAASPGGASASATYTYQAVGTYTVKVTAIDNGGLAGFSTFTAQVSLPPVVTLSPVVGPNRSTKAGAITAAGAPLGAPYALIAAATPDTGRTIVSYQWDFDGDGTVDLVTASSASTDTESFAYPLATLYLAKVTVIDDVGIPGSATLAVPVYQVLLSSNAASTLSGGTITFTATPYPPAGLSVLGYTWSFGDGTTASTPAATPTISHVYGGSRVVQATVTVNLSNSTSGISPVVLIRVIGQVLDDTNPTVIASLTQLASLTLPADVTLRVGHEATFTATIFAGSGVDGNGAVTTVAWDLDGDGIRDVEEDFTSSKLLQANSVVTYQYPYPGVFKVKVVAGTSFGQTLRGSFKVTVAQGTPPVECWMVQPHNGAVVEGNHVSLSARGAPANKIKSVTYQYRPSGTGPWTSIATVTPPPITALSAPWDVTHLVSGAYDLQAVATASDSSTASSWSVRPVTVTVDSAQVPDQQETAGPDGVPQVRIQTIDPSKPDSTEISQDTRIEFPAHSTTTAAGSSYSRCRIERTADDPHPVESRFQGITFVPGLFRRLDLGTDTLTAPAKVCLYVPTASYNQALGSVGLSALNSPSVDLTIYRFDDVTTQSWVPLFSHIRQPSEALVRASAMSVGDLGVGFEASPRAASGSSSSSSWSGCGALGIESLAILFLLRGLRAVRTQPRRD